MLLYEFKADLNAYLAELGPTRRSARWRTSSRSTRRTASEEMPYFGQELCSRPQAKGPLTEPAYHEALAKNRRLSRDEGIDAVMTEHRLDALVAPTGGPPWLIDLVNGDPLRAAAASTPAAVAGYPHITVPRGSSTGCRWACRSSAGPGASRRCSSSPTPSSRRPATAGPRASLHAQRRSPVGRWIVHCHRDGMLRTVSTSGYGRRSSGTYARPHGAAPTSGILLALAARQRTSMSRICNWPEP